MNIVSLSKNLKILSNRGYALLETSKTLRTPFSVPMNATLPSLLTSKAVGFEKNVILESWLKEVASQMAALQSSEIVIN